jgi:hypothetical protein
VVAYCARSSGAVWKSFDDAGVSPLKQLQLYATAAARGDLARVDRAVEVACEQIDAHRHDAVVPMIAEARTASA